ncbi:MAG: hypothetical protein C4617_03830 [Candidatus Liberibacter europaeus]|uniref:DUF5681 domain-containing protein n=1 Tax=Candidatus Liberibacter europaeus TaxID=744859 RepID=A0A2T4VX44_9HYPH|nr:hypothetical protein [Candidatus Liberibacter europaeus]PTL86343.1 MAG: hypothetical protein C4617_03830 [Candidatus Liberibacter europaeus]
MSIIKFCPIEKKSSERNRFAGRDIPLRSLYRDVFANDFLKHGRKVVRILRKEKPEQYLRIIAQILLKEDEYEGDTSNGDQLTDEELCEIIRSLEEELQFIANSKRKNADSSAVEKTSLF